MGLNTTGERGILSWGALYPRGMRGLLPSPPPLSPTPDTTLEDLFGEQSLMEAEVLGWAGTKAETGTGTGDETDNLADYNTY